MKNDELDLIIEKSLSSEPLYQLPAGFAQKVMLKVVRTNQLKNDFRDYIYLTLIAISLLATAGGLYYYINKPIMNRLLDFIAHNVFQFICVALLLNFILFADRVLLPFLFSRAGSIKAGEKGI